MFQVYINAVPSRSECPPHATLIAHREDDNQRVREEAQSEHLRRIRAAELDSPVRTLNTVIFSVFPQQQQETTHCHIVPDVSKNLHNTLRVSTIAEKIV